MAAGPGPRWFGYRSALPHWSVGFGARAVHAVVFTPGRTVAGEQGRPGSGNGYQGGHTWQTRTAADGCVRRVTGWFPVSVSELRCDARLVVDRSIDSLTAAKAGRGICPISNRIGRPTPGDPPMFGPGGFGGARCRCRVQSQEVETWSPATGPVAWWGCSVPGPVYGAGRRGGGGVAEMVRFRPRELLR